jgi:hypothetical protein
VGRPLASAEVEGSVLSAESFSYVGAQTALGGWLRRILSQRVNAVRSAVSAARAPLLLQPGGLCARQAHRVLGRKAHQVSHVPHPCGDRLRVRQPGKEGDHTPRSSKGLGTP